MNEKTKHTLSLTLFFAAFLFLWVTVLALGSHAGEGRLSARQQEQAYYVQQALLILGLLAYAGLARLLPAGRVRRGCAAYYPAVALAVMPCLGALGGVVYHRMSRETARGTALQSKAPTCEEMGDTTYSAAFENPAFAAQSALTKSPTETEAGEHTFRSAVYQNKAFAAQTKIAADVPALGTLTGLTLPASLTKIENEAFEHGAFQYVIVPASCGSIGQKAFAYCDAMVYIKIPASVAEIAPDAFEGCGSGLVIDRLE